MRKSWIFVTVLVFAIGIRASAQQATPILSPGSGGVLTPLSQANFNVARMKGEACGPYFHFIGVPADRTKVGKVVFVFVKDTSLTAKDIGILEMGTDKLEIHVVAGKKIPEVKVVRTGGPIFPWMEIWISPEDYQKAPCLVHSKKATTQQTTEVFPMVDAKRTIMKLPALGKDAEIDRLRCGDYFLFEAANPNMKPVGARIGFSTRPLGGEKGSMLWHYLKEKFQTFITDEKEPKAKLVLRHGSAQAEKQSRSEMPALIFKPEDISHIAIYIGQADYKKATCLPKP